MQEAREGWGRESKGKTKLPVMGNPGSALETSYLLIVTVSMWKCWDLNSELWIWSFCFSPTTQSCIPQGQDPDTEKGVPFVAQQQTVSMKMWVQSLALLSGLRIPCCCELWCRSAATAPIRPLAWEPPYAEGVDLEKAKHQKKKKKKITYRE